MVKKRNNFLESLNLFENKSGKKSYNGILIIAGILGMLVLSGLVVGFANPAGMLTESVKLFNESGIEIGNSLLPKSNFSNTYNEGTTFILRVNVSDGAGLDTVPDRNITKVNITFDNSFVVLNYTFNISNGNLSTYNASGSEESSFFNRTLSNGTWVSGTISRLHINNSLWGNTFHWLNTTGDGLLGNNTISSNNQSFYFNVSNAVPGTYNITVMLQNGTGTSADSTASRNFTIRINDTTAPNFVNLHANSTGFSSITPVLSDVAVPTTTTKVNLSSKTQAVTLYASVNVTDFNETGSGGIGYAGQGIIRAYFQIFNDTGLMNGTSNRTLALGVRENVAFNLTGHIGLVTNLTDGNYMIVIRNFTDIGNNTNATAIAYNVTIDGTNPSVTIAKASTSTQHQLVLDLTVSDATSGINGKQCSVSGGGTDGITMSGTAGAQTATQSGLGCNTAYTYTVACTDHAGNTNSQDVSLSTSTCTGGSSGGSSSSGSGTTGTTVGSASSAFWTLTYNEATLDMSDDSDGVSANLAENYRVKLKVDAKLYYIGVTEATETTATINVTTSATQDRTATFSIGDVNKFDVNADNTYDLAITLNGISAGKADLSVVYIQEPMSAEEQEAVEEQVTQEGAAAPETGKSNTWIWIVAGIVVLGIIGAAVFGRKKSRYKNYGF